MNQQKSEQQSMYEAIRHLVSSNYKVPEHLTLRDLHNILTVLSNTSYKVGAT